MLRALVDATSVGLCVLTPDGRIALANRAACELLGRDEHELAAMHWEHLVDPRDRSLDLDGRRRLLAGECQDRDVDVRILRRDGETLWLRETHCLLPDADAPSPRVLLQLTALAGDFRGHGDRDALRRRLAEIQAVARIGDWQWDARGDAITGSDQFFRLFEREPRQLGDLRSFLAALHPEDRATVERAVGDVLDERRAEYDVEYRIELPGGALRYIHARGQALFDAAGRRIGLFGTCQDISDRKRADAALRDAKDWLEQRVQERTETLHRVMAYTRSLIEASSDPLLIIDSDGRITDLNRAAEAATGVKRSELIGSEFAPYFADPTQARRIHRQALETGQVRGHELELRHVDGRTMTVMFNATIFHDPAGDVAGVCATARDITDIRRTRAELLRSKRLLDETGRLALVGGWEFDPGTGTLSWTEVVRTIHEVSPDFRPTLDHALAFVVPDARPAISDAIERALRDGTPFDLELPLTTARGRTIWVRWLGRAYTERGEVSRIGGVIRDITERRSADEELMRHRDHLEDLVSERTAELAAAIAHLERSNRDLEQFAYVASHDLQEPLRMVASYTQLLAERYRGQLDERAEKYIAYAVDGAKRMQGLINDLLAFSRIGTRGGAIEATDAGEVVAAVLLDLQRAIESSGATIEVGPLPTVQADATQLRQVFQNLIENAIKFRGEAPPIVTISAERRRNFWVFTVRDNGIGIEPQYRERIFALFQRLHERGRYPGSGIGLAIVKKIIERHGGTIRVESAPINGCSFIFSLPCSDSARDHADDGESDDPAGRRQSG